MIRLIPIEALPNQQLSISIGNNLWLLALKVANDSMFIDITLNNVPLIIGQRIAVGTPCIPYNHLANEGNFIFLTDNEDLPDWQKFGVTQQLLYTAHGVLAYVP